MQKFALIHDGTVQGWQATYQAFHVANRLGAPLQVLIVDPDQDKAKLAQRAAQVEVGGRAAGVAMETHLLTDFSMDALKESITAIDGLFLPQRLTPDGETVASYLDAFSCPLWIVSKESEIKKIAVLVNDLAEDTPLISYTKTLSHRLQQSLTVILLKDKLQSDPAIDLQDLQRLELSTLSQTTINQELEKLHIGLLFISATHANMINELSCNCVVNPMDKRLSKD